MINSTSNIEIPTDEEIKAVLDDLSLMDIKETMTIMKIKINPAYYLLLHSYLERTGAGLSSVGYPSSLFGIPVEIDNETEKIEYIKFG